jgi:hypothetical protein
MDASSLSPAGQALNLSGVPTPYETEEARKKRLAALTSAQKSLGVGLMPGAGLSPAGQSLLGGY